MAEAVSTAAEEVSTVAGAARLAAGHLEDRIGLRLLPLVPLLAGTTQGQPGIPIVRQQEIPRLPTRVVNARAGQAA